MREFVVIDAPQRSDGWKRARAGRLTASRAKDMLATIKSGEAAARRDLRVQLVVERLTGEPQEDAYVTADMQRGLDLEADAFAAYEALTGQLPARCGFVAHTEHCSGYSPDGVLDDFDGLLELKVPRSATHLGYLRSGGVPPEHLAQLTHALWVTGAQYIDFVSFDPRFPAPLRTFHVHLPRQSAEVTSYADRALAFLAEVDREYQALQTMADLTVQWERCSGG